MTARARISAEVDDPVSTTDFARLYRDHWRPLLRLAQGLVDDTASAEDIVQESFAALFANQATLHDPAKASSYLHSCVINKARSALRRRRTVRAKLSIVSSTATAPAADERALLTEEHHAVRKALNTLPRRQREVLGLRLLCDLTDQEIAVATGMSHAHVRSAASRGLATLRTALEARS